MTMPARPLSREEGQFVKAFAHALNHATAVVAADPDRPPFPAGSLAERIRQAYSRFHPDEQLARQRRARASLAESPEVRRRYFGAYGELDTQALYRSGPGLDREMKEQLKLAVRARLDAQREAIEEAVSITGATTFLGTGAATKPWLEVGHLDGDMQVGWKKLTINQPINLHFRWGTEETEAERGVWQLVRVGTSGKEVHLAYGVAGQAPGSTFDIDLSQHLSPNAPALPADYRIRVTPGTNPKMAPGVMKGQAGPKIPGKAAGFPSDPVVITYTGIVAPPVEFQIFEMYTKLWFTLGSIYMVKDQFGPGVEEFFVSGFVQENLPSSSALVGTQEKFGKFYAELDPDGLRDKQLSHASIFYLNSPTTPEWPRAYTVVISVLEVDDGGSLSDWQAAVWDAAKDLMGTDVSQILGFVVAARSFVAANIIAGAADDYYGTEVSTWVLPTNLPEYVHSLPGEVTADGGFALESPNGVSLHGHTQWPNAAPTDGQVDITFQWELTDRAIG